MHFLGITRSRRYIFIYLFKRTANPNRDYCRKGKKHRIQKVTRIQKWSSHQSRCGLQCRHTSHCCDNATKTQGSGSMCIRPKLSRISFHELCTSDQVLEMKGAWIFLYGLRYLICAIGSGPVLLKLETQRGIDLQIETINIYHHSAFSFWLAILGEGVNIYSNRLTIM